MNHKPGYYWDCPNCGEVHGTMVTYEETHITCGANVTAKLCASPTTEQAELWKDVDKLFVDVINYAIGAERTFDWGPYKNARLEEMKRRFIISLRSQAPESGLEPKTLERLRDFYEQQFLKEPVTFLLQNALRHLNSEQLIALKNALVERTPKEEVPEAVEFGYWMHKHDHGSDNHDRIDKLYEAFQLYKKQKP